MDPNGKFKKTGGKYLNLVRGETLEVIELTNEKKLLCRNAHGKCKCTVNTALCCIVITPTLNQLQSGALNLL